MVDRLLKLSVLPICISMLIGVVLIGPQLRQGGIDADSSDQSSRSAPEISHFNVPGEEPALIQPYPEFAEIDESDSGWSTSDVAGGGDTSSVESIDLTGILDDSWGSTDQVSSQETGTEFRGGFISDHDATGASNEMPYTDTSSGAQSLRSPTNGLALNSPGEEMAPTFTNDRSPNSLNSNGLIHPSHRDQPNMNQPYQDQTHVVENFPQSGTIHHDPLQSSIAPPNRPSGSVMEQPQAQAQNQNTNLRLPQHVVERLHQQLENAAVLARKGALFSARNEFIHTLYLIAEARDSMLGTRMATKQLEAALTAMRESDDFSRNHQSRDYHLDLNRIVSRHDTPVLDAEVGNPITPLEAMRRYYEFAGHNLMSSFGNEPIAANALHALGKLHIMPGGLAENGEAYAVPKAVVFFQSAVTINPADSKSANELGVQLARLGEWGGAKQAFLQSVAAQPSIVAWQNLAVVHQHLNEGQLAQLAENEAGMLMQQQQQQQAASPQVSTAAGPVEFIGPSDFASQSPMNTPYGGDPSYVGDNGRSRAPDANNRTANQSGSRKSLLDWF